MEYLIKDFKENTKYKLFLFISIIAFLLVGFYSFYSSQFTSENRIKFCIWMFLFVLGIIFLSNYIYKKSLKPEKIMLCTVPFICILYIIFMPTFKNHDEIWHWYRSYEISEGYMVAQKNGNELGELLPTSITTPMGIDLNNKTNDEIVDELKKVNYKLVSDSMELKLETEDKTIVYSNTAAVYNFVQYLPQAIGIAIVRIFTDKVLLIAYGGRLLNMIISIALMYFAIKKMPFGKNILLLMCFMPTVIESFSSLSPDALTIGISALFVAYIFNLAFDKNKKEVTKKDIAIISAMGIVLSLCKIVYLPITLLVYIIPKEKFRNGRKIFKLSAIIALFFLINMIWLVIASKYLSMYNGGSSNIQIQEVLSNPWNYFLKLVYSVQFQMYNNIRTMVGGSIGWDGISISSIVPIYLLIVCIWNIIIDDTIKNKLKNYQTYIISFIAIVIIGLIYSSLYVQWTSKGSKVIEGVQGRYFLPILPIVYLCLGNFIKIKSDYNQEKITKYIGIVGLIVQIYPLAQMLHFFM